MWRVAERCHVVFFVDDVEVFCGGLGVVKYSMDLCFVSNGVVFGGWRVWDWKGYAVVWVGLGSRIGLFIEFCRPMDAN
jgi:hypothetical protein